MKTFGNVIIFMMSLTFILLAFQAEPFTAAAGYIFGGLLFVALIAQFRRGANVRGNDTTEKG
jgi:hypothetical protein